MEWFILHSFNQETSSCKWFKTRMAPGGASIVWSLFISRGSWLKAERGFAFICIINKTKSNPLKTAFNQHQFCVL